MRKFYLSIFALLFFVNCFSQNVYKKPAALGINFFLIDFKTAADIRANGLANVLRSKQFFKPGQMNVGIGISYLKGLSDHVDFAGALGTSSGEYPINNISLTGLLLESTAGINIKLLSDKYTVNPFLNVGAGASTYEGVYYAAFAPVGAGLQINIFDEAYILLNSQYRIPVTQNAGYHFYHGFGIAGNIGSKRVEAPKEVELPIVTDRDNDGVLDSLDACPDTAGLAALNGCPDKDGDGIADKDDTCPDVAGTAKYQGCPVPDTDKDGINDEEDKCPNVPGVARYQGCPIPDTDGDGVNDEEDKCPNEAGVATNFGCPEIKPEIIEKVNLAARNVFFATGSSKLLAKSYASLNNVVKILTDNPTFKVDIDGHTDTTGNSEKNHVLSHDRANSVKAYLVSKGIDESRMTSQGFGPDQPIASNKTAAGRAKNRRVEMKLRNY